MRVMTQTLKCVVCGVETLDRYLTPEEPDQNGQLNIGYDHLAVTVHPDKDDYEPDNLLKTRGGYVEIDLLCSEGHVQRLVIANHKGIEELGLFEVT